MTSPTPRADFWFSILLTGFGAAVFFESWRMPRLENLGIDPMSAPGLTPGLLGVVMTGLGLALMLRGRPRRGPVVDAEAGWGRLATTLGLCLAYALVLLGRAPFWLATGAFVAAFVLAFTWTEKPAWRTGLFALGLAAATSAAVTLLFEQLFLVRLP